jgi:hypothetical protein
MTVCGTEKVFLIGPQEIDVLSFSSSITKRQNKLQRLFLQAFSAWSNICE